MSDLSEFLLARIAEDEAVARNAEHRSADIDAVEVVWYRHDDGWTPSAHGKWLAGHALFERFDSARILAECEAKRRIVEGAERLGPDARDYWQGSYDTMDAVLRLLALPYADHPNYRKEWRPAT